MGGAHRHLGPVLQPQPQPALGAELSVPPPTGQSEDHGGGPSESGGHVGVNEVRRLKSDPILVKIFKVYVGVKRFEPSATIVSMFSARCLL